MENPENPDGVADVVESEIQKLIAEFGSRLDESLIRAVASDVNLPEAHEDARAILIPLAEFAPAEEASGFDPSGLGHQSDSEVAGLGGDTADDGTPGSQLSPTDFATSISEASESCETPCFSGQTNLSDEDKVENLRMIFSLFKDHTLKFVLKNAGGDLEKAFEELLSRQFLEENGELAKGVDGFYVADENTRSEKGSRIRKYKPGRKQVPVTYSHKSLSADVDGLDEIMRGAALKPSRIPQPQSQQRQSVERANGSPSHLPQPSTTSTAKATGWNVVEPRKRTTKTKDAVPSFVPEDTRMTNAQTAAALYRKGSSHPLYRQAAGVYTERTREDARMAQAAAFASYGKLVDGQSSYSKIDLHGVPVLDGVKIAKNRVNNWWMSLAEGEREKRGTVSGLTVVTGVGYHSANGISRLRQAVGAMLKNDGWKFETLTGEFYITGRV